MRTLVLMFCFTLFPVGCEQVGQPDIQALQQEVFATERAFAAAVEKRDFAAFTDFLSGEAVFFSGGEVLHGKQAVADYWQRYFTAASAPFSWEPKTVEITASGSLALSTGPVRNPAGECTGTYTSIWRHEAPGQWRIVFDRGSGDCEGN